MDNKVFGGFNPAFFQFLEDLKANNNKVWFQENKERYRKVVQDPLLDFVVAMEKPLQKISPHYVADPRRNGGSIFRIYRDVRFSKDKTPYKEHAACNFRHEAGKDVHAPGFYLHLANDKLIFGGGVWGPSSDVLYQIRDAIREKPSEWKKVINNKTFKETFAGVDGESLVRPPNGFDKNLPYITDIKRKSFYAMREADPKLALEDGFFNEVVKTYNALTPLLKFICKAIDLPY